MPLQWIVFAALSIAFAIFAAVTTYWPDIIAQPPSAALFLGALAGAGGGLLAIILGALLNAELNRRRDDRLRREETEALIKSSAGEMEAIAIASRAHVKLLRNADVVLSVRMLRLIEPTRALIFEANADKIGWIPEAPRNKIFHALITKEIVAAGIRGLLTHPAETPIPIESRAACAEQSERLVADADNAASDLRQAEVP